MRKTGNFNTEALKRISAVSSPYVAKIIAFSENEMIMEYIDGEPLSRAKLPRDLYGIFRELCEGVCALHSAGVIHRDIKPSNIMLCGEHIKMIDFDAARLKKTEAEKDTVFIGTDGFAPPEQYGFRQTDERSDIYAIGVTVKLLLREDYQRSPLRSVAEKCMRFDPNRRYASAKAVSRAVALRKYRPAVSGAAALALCAALILLISRVGSAPATNAAVSETSAVTAAEKTAATTAAEVAGTSAAAEEIFMADIPEESIRKAPWSGAENLPEGFPALCDMVSEIENPSSEGMGNKFRCSYIYWDRAEKEESALYAASILAWLDSADYEYEVVSDGEDDGWHIHYSWVFNEPGDWTTGGMIHLNWYPERWERAQLELFVTLKNY